MPRSHIEAMTAALAHRGPDGEGFHGAPGIALGHRRLKVIDLEGGAQPMSDPAESVWVVYNGEIYNYRALREELAQRGRSFRTESDTEVLIQGYLEWGPELLQRLNGMFAFAIWDARQRLLIMARDPMGQKPLFYGTLSDGTLLFASELRGLAAHPALSPEVDPAGLAGYLTFEYLPGSLSMVRGIRKLEPGHRMIHKAGRSELSRYWTIPFGEPMSWKGRETVEAFRDCFDRAVERRLMSDVPLGVFLSGGIDSSSVAASVVRSRPPESVLTFSIGFDQPSFDESGHARRVATHLGTNHHEATFSIRSMSDTLSSVTKGLDEPLGDASLLPTYLLSSFARETVTVALGGDGADELLLGYPTFRADPVARLFRRSPAWLRHLSRRLAARLPVKSSNFSLDFVVSSFLRAAERDDALRHPLWLASVIPGDDEDPLHPELRELFPIHRVLEPAVRAYHAPSNVGHLERLSAQYCATYLAEDILQKVDRASMAVSLEVRAPFMDPEVVSFLARVPSRYKRRGVGAGKVILKRAMGERLPSSILHRKKKGFGIPMAEWLKGPLKPLMLELLDPDRTSDAGYFDVAVVNGLVRAHLEERRNHRKTLWTLMVFELWRDSVGIGARS